MESVSRTPAKPVPRKVMKTTLTSVDLSDRLASVEGEKEDEERVKESQVMWCDPQEALEREALKDKLDAETQDLGSNNMDTMELVNNMDTMDVSWKKYQYILLLILMACGFCVDFQFHEHGREPD